MKLLGALKHLVMHNFGLKVLSLLLAVLIHVVVQRESVREAVVDLPISIINVPHGQVLAGSVPEVVKARVRGRWGGIRELLTDRSARIVVDAGVHRSGDRYVFKQRAVTEQLATAHVEVLAVEPAWLDLRFEALDRRNVPAQALIIGDPAPGFRVITASTRVDPAKVEVYGPASQVRKLEALRTAPVDLAGTDHDLHLAVRLQGPPGHALHMTPEEVTVDVHLEELNIERTLARQPVVARGCPPQSRCTLEPAEIDLKIEGPTRAVSALVAHPPDNIVFADLSAPAARGDHSLRLEVHAVKGLTITPWPAVAKFSIVSDKAPQP